MINLEHVKLLDAKVAKAIEYVERLTKENAALHRQEAELQARLRSYQKRIDELEVLVMGFKEDQGQIEESILTALDRLNQFEKAIEKSLKDKPAGAKGSAKEPATVLHTKPQQAAPQQAEPAKAVPEQAADAQATGDSGSGEGQTCFEIPEDEDDDDIPDPLANTQDTNPSTSTDTTPAESGELDIF